MKIYFPIKKGAIKTIFKEEIEYPADSIWGRIIVFVIAMACFLGPVFILIEYYNPKTSIFKPIGIVLLIMGVIGYFTLFILDRLYGD